MEPLALSSAPPVSAPPRTLGRAMATIALLAGLWAILINQLRVDWAINPQYSFGWIVPVLTLYLVWKRWANRPPAAALPHARRWGLVAVLLALAILPTRVVQESAPYWSAVSWSLALQTVGLTLVILAFLGGAPWARHFAPALCFFLVAVPWPSTFETAVTQGLMKEVAAFTVEILGWIGVPAYSNGNLIHLEKGVLGVDEACSGVRSLQSMFMSALFVGELYWLTWRSRLGLLWIGLLLALAFNVLRTLFLALIAQSQGLAALEKWHDPAGFAILTMTFLSLVWSVRFFETNELEDLPDDARRPVHLLPTSVLFVGVAWMALLEVATESWYRVHESATPERGGWKAAMPVVRAEFRNVPINPVIQEILRADEGLNTTWTDERGHPWLLYFFKWHPTKTSRQSARFHRPEVCLPAAGRTLVEERPRILVRVGEASVLFRSYSFLEKGQPLHVFFSLCEGEAGEVQATDMMADSRLARLRRVLEGRRDLGQQSIEVAVWGYPTAEEAEAHFRREMATLIEPAP